MDAAPLIDLCIYTTYIWKTLPRPIIATKGDGMIVIEKVAGGGNEGTTATRGAYVD